MTENRERRVMRRKMRKKLAKMVSTNMNTLREELTHFPMSLKSADVVRNLA